MLSLVEHLEEDDIYNYSPKQKHVCYFYNSDWNGDKSLEYKRQWHSKNEAFLTYADLPLCLFPYWEFCETMG